MKRHIAVVVALAAVGWIFFGQSYGAVVNDDGTLKPLPNLSSFSAPSLTAPGLQNASAQVLAWKTWEDYLKYAKNHDLAGLRSISYQLSPVCVDPTKEEQCFALMDSVSGIAGAFSAQEFKYVESDAKQIIMYTDGPEKKILYFVREPNGALKLLGLKICVEDEANPELTCEDLNVDTRDDNNDGWWNSTEALFR